MTELWQNARLKGVIPKLGRGALEVKHFDSCLIFKNQKRDGEQFILILRECFWVGLN